MGPLSDIRTFKSSLHMKFINFFLLIILIISAGIFSCNKEDPPASDSVFIGDSTKVEGRILEYGNNKPIPNATVVLREGLVYGFSGSPGYENIDTQYTDASGYYKFYFKHRVSGINSKYAFLYDIRVYANQYFRTESGVQHGWWNKNRNIILNPYAWIKVYIKNVNPFDEMDYLWLGGGGNYYGTNIDTSEILLVFGNRMEIIVWFIGHNKIKARVEDSIFVIAHDTLFYEILY